MLMKLKTEVWIRNSLRTLSISRISLIRVRRMSLSVNSRVQVLNVPVAAPGVCCLSGSATTPVMSLVNLQFEEMKRQNHLLISKDLTTFSTLQTLTTTNNSPVATVNFDPSFIPRDDESMARFIAQRYEEQGIDPAAAFDSTDDAL